MDLKHLHTILKPHFIHFIWYFFYINTFKNNGFPMIWVSQLCSFSCSIEAPWYSENPESITTNPGSYDSSLLSPGKFYLILLSQFPIL